jgi:hypothetical protein
MIERTGHATIRVCHDPEHMRNDLGRKRWRWPRPASCRGGRAPRWVLVFMLACRALAVVGVLSPGRTIPTPGPPRGKATPAPDRQRPSQQHRVVGGAFHQRADRGQVLAADDGYSPWLPANTTPTAGSPAAGSGTIRTGRPLPSADEFRHLAHLSAGLSRVHPEVGPAAHHARCIGER